MVTKSKFLFFLLLTLLLTLPASPVNAAETPIVTIDGTEVIFDIDPVIVEGRVLVPLRAVFESLGAEVNWNPETQTVSAGRNPVRIVLQSNSQTALINEQQVFLDVRPLFISGRIMVPLRFVAEGLGAAVNWDESAYTVAIFSNLPYDLSSYHVLENNIKQLLNQENEAIYANLEKQIKQKLKREDFDLLESYLRRTYAATVFENGTFTGKSPEKGQGIYEWNNGEKYVGDWVDNNMEGKGLYCWKDGSYYIGEWKNSTKTGWGILHSSSGNVYIGEWLEDRLSGRGIYYWSNGEKYLGQWAADERTGLGYYYWNSGNKISGQFDRGVLNGLGVYSWYDGEMYIGEFSNNVINGRGKHYFNNGLVFCGEFQDKCRISGTYLHPDGKMVNLQQAASQIARTLTGEEMTDLEKVKILHDYVVNAIEYDRGSPPNGIINEESHTAYGALVNKKAVCDGYTELLHALLNAAGIENIFVVGEAKGEKDWEGHAWLIVNIDGRYFHLDATWNDLDDISSPDYTYFNLSDAQMEKDHRWDRNAYPPCPGNDDRA